MSRAAPPSPWRVGGSSSPSAFFSLKCQPHDGTPPPTRVRTRASRQRLARAGSRRHGLRCCSSTEAVARDVSRTRSRRTRKRRARASVRRALMSADAGVPAARPVLSRIVHLGRVAGRAPGTLPTTRKPIGSDRVRHRRSAPGHARSTGGTFTAYRAGPPRVHERETRGGARPTDAVLNLSFCGDFSTAHAHADAPFTRRSATHNREVDGSNPSGAIPQVGNLL